MGAVITAAPPSKVQRGHSLAGIANQKLYDNFRSLTAVESDSLRNPADCRTLRARLASDVTVSRASRTMSYSAP